MVYKESDFSVRPCGDMTSTKDELVIDCLPNGGYLDTHGKIVPAAMALTDIYSLLFKSEEAAQFEVNRFTLLQTIDGAKDGDCIPVKDPKIFTVAGPPMEKLRKFNNMGPYTCVGVDKAASGQDKNAVRVFATGATRDTDEGKLSYSKGLSFPVLRRYLQYLGKHRTLSDGSQRDWDNWKKGIDSEVYRDSLTRHVADVNIVADGYSAEDNHGKCDLEDLLCAVMFNSMGWLYEILESKKENHGGKTTADHNDNM